MNLRWYITEHKIDTWNDRWEEYDSQTIQSKPVLQYEAGNNNWITVPTVIERIEDGRKGY